MGKREYEPASDNWNVADSYAKVKIMTLLAEIDMYIKVALTGAIDLQEEFIIPQQNKINARIIALRRLNMTEQMLINNSLFGVKKKGKTLLLEWLKALKKIDVNKTYNVVTNKDRMTSQVIKEKEFSIVLNILIDIHRNILIPLNEAGMIYPSGEEDWEVDDTL